MTKQEFLEKAKSIHGSKYDYTNLSEKFTRYDKIEMMYNNEMFTQTVCKHLMGRCPEKNTPRKTTEQFIKEAKEVWGDKYDYSLTIYKGALKKVKIIYDGEIFEQTAVTHLVGSAPELNMTQSYFIKKAIRKWGDKYDYSLVDFKNSKDKVKIIYNGKIYEQTPSNHLNGACENVSLLKTNDVFIEECNIAHNFKYDYSKTLYTNAKGEVIIICPIHKEFKQVAYSHLVSGCPYCNVSKGEKEVIKHLDSLNVKYLRQHKFEDCKNIKKLSFDFYLPELNICIEYDGEQHFKPIEIFGGEKKLEKQKINDSIKTNYCLEKGIRLIRIPYWELKNIENVINNI